MAAIPAIATFAAIVAVIPSPATAFLSHAIYGTVAFEETRATERTERIEEAERCQSEKTSRRS